MVRQKKEGFNLYPVCLIGVLWGIKLDGGKGIQTYIYLQENGDIKSEDKL